MTRYRPYILTTTVFCVLFFVTQVLPIPMTYFGFEDTTIGEMHNSNRTVIQFYIFFIGLNIWLTVMNNLHRLNTNIPTIYERIYISWLVIISVYTINYVTFEIVDADGFSIYYDYKDNLAFPLAFWSVILTSIFSWTTHKLWTILTNGKMKINTTHNNR